MESKLYNTQRAVTLRLAMVLYGKGVGFDSPTGKVPVTVTDGGPVVNQYLDEIFEYPRLPPEEAKERTRVTAATDGFFPAVFSASNSTRKRSRPWRGSRRSWTFWKSISCGGTRVPRGGYFSLVGVTCANDFVRLREGATDLGDCPGVAAKMEASESYGASV